MTDCFFLSAVLLPECIVALNHKINQSCIHSGYEYRLLMGLRRASWWRTPLQFLQVHVPHDLHDPLLLNSIAHEHTEQPNYIL